MLFLSGGGGGTEKGLLVRNRKPGDDVADLRDSVGVLVGGGYTGFSDDESKAQFSRISSILGQRGAQDLISHIFIQNTRPEFKLKTPIQRITNFYDINASKPETSSVLQKIKSFAYGPEAGFRDSVDVAAQKLQGNTLPNKPANPSITKQITPNFTTGL